MSSFGKLISVFLQEYKKQPSKIKLIDTYLAYILITGVIQFVYCLLVGTFPFNSFLAGFISTVGTFVMTGSCDP
jgi:oligosaccharyltransferase complex subunit epsilon